ncbi:hypothetical protein A7U60_g5352 [Sanghuangporus baumii]|uniref:Uncharacterized protein n=1 Tax=Sanghuangporus baumii TaxID=108892 RepID=A0A9Q5HWT0_SANBA|nr:hypothetical protein A7U60_g5352 [Sanghuangporus baumii]
MPSAFRERLFFRLLPTVYFLIVSDLCLLEVFDAQGNTAAWSFRLALYAGDAVIRESIVNDDFDLAELEMIRVTSSPGILFSSIWKGFKGRTRWKSENFPNTGDFVALNMIDAILAPNWRGEKLRFSNDFTEPEETSVRNFGDVKDTFFTPSRFFNRLISVPRFGLYDLKRFGMRNHIKVVLIFWDIPHEGDCSFVASHFIIHLDDIGERIQDPFNFFPIQVARRVLSAQSWLYIRVPTQSGKLTCSYFQDAVATRHIWLREL